jgi:hypothetical protein
VCIPPLATTLLELAGRVRDAVAVVMCFQDVNFWKIGLYIVELYQY